MQRGRARPGLSTDPKPFSTDSYPGTGLGRPGATGLPGEPFLAEKPPNSLGDCWISKSFLKITALWANSYHPL
jgi:hypothetical protein